ncbi:hypothetical protein V3C99_015028 [Haemonchus contortus]
MAADRRRTISPPNSLATSLLDGYLDEHDEDDLLRAENESLRVRVTELEKIVDRQQSELMLLQTTSADLLRRMAKLEISSSPTNNGIGGPSSKASPKVTARLPPRNISQSSYNIAKTASPSRNGLSRSLHVHNTREACIDENPGPQVSPASLKRQTSAAIVNVSVGKSLRGSPLRKWMSHQNVKGSPTSGVPVGDLSVSGRTTPSVCSPSRNLSSWTVSRSVSRAASVCTLNSPSRNHSNSVCNNREPIFNASSHTLQLQVAGRSVAVPVPESIENIDPAAEQPPPDCPSPQIEWAYGYRGKDVRYNVHYLPTGELVYFCGSVVVMHNISEQHQRHYTGHTSDVKCICIHPNRVIVASGQTTCHRRDRRPEFGLRDSVATPQEIKNELENNHTEAHVRIWDSVTLATLHVLGGSKAMFEKSIAALSFSNTDGGNLLACTDESYTHLLSVWKWSDEVKLAEAKGANDQIFAVSWHPLLRNLIVMCGRGHFSFWQFDAKNETLTKNVAIFEGRDKPKTLLSMCFSETGDVITGDSNGTLSLWDPITFKTKKQAHGVHPGGVFALCISRKGTLLSAGKDRTVAEFETTDLVRRRRPIELPDDGGIPKVILNLENNQIVVGTTRNTLYLGDFETAFEEIVDGDSDDVTCCVAVKPHFFITASADGGVRYYDSSTKKREWRKSYGEGITCMSVDRPGTSLGLGFCGGSWSVVDLSTKETVFEQKESTQPITAIQFSPDSTLLIVATKELSVLIYRTDGSQRFHRAARVGTLSSFVVSMDWDITSQFIRANSAVGHIYHWSATNGELVDNACICDAEWTSCNCRVSYEAGCLTHSVEGITSISRSNSKEWLVVGRDNGSLRLYNCPVLSTAAGFLALAGHSYAVSSVIFTEEKHLITAGVTDGSLFQWKFQL